MIGDASAIRKIQRAPVNRTKKRKEIHNSCCIRLALVSSQLKETTTYVDVVDRLAIIFVHVAEPTFAIDALRKRISATEETISLSTSVPNGRMEKAESRKGCRQIRYREAVKREKYTYTGEWVFQNYNCSFRCRRPEKKKKNSWGKIYTLQNTLKKIWERILIFLLKLILYLRTIKTNLSDSNRFYFNTSKPYLNNFI